MQTWEFTKGKIEIFLYLNGCEQMFHNRFFIKNRF